MNIKKLVFSILSISIVVIVILLINYKFQFFRMPPQITKVFYNTTAPRIHMHDEADLIPKTLIWRFEDLLGRIFKESDIDIRIILIKNTGNKTIEEVAAEKINDFKIGKDNNARGLLILYDHKGEKIHIEVGYGLEEFFPDAFIGYLNNQHTDAFFTAGRVSKGLQLLTRILHHRIREAKLGMAYDPTAIETIRKRRNLSGGAGASQTMQVKRSNEKFLGGTLSKEKREVYYGPQPTPEEAYKKHIEWYLEGVYDTKIGLLTPPSQEHMARLTMTQGYLDFMLLLIFEKAYKIEIRNDLALLYFTDSPFAVPLFFIKGKDGWKMDIMAEMEHSIDTVGGAFTWFFRVADDKYSRTFFYKLIKYDNYTRIVDGDNRMLPMRNQKINKPRIRLPKAPAKKEPTGSWTALHQAAADGDLQLVKTLLNSHDVNILNKKGRPPLYEAAKRGHLQVVKFLHSKGAKLNIFGSDIGFTPLHIASEQHHSAIVRYLLANDVDVNIKNDWGQTPLWQASWQAWHEDAEIAEILYKNGADFNTQDRRGYTPLHRASIAGHVSLVYFLINIGADINIQTLYGSTPLCKAAKEGVLLTAQILLQNGADKSISCNGKTAADLARENGHKDIAQLLL